MLRVPPETIRQHFLQPQSASQEFIVEDGIIILNDEYTPKVLNHKLELSILILTLNEEKNIEALLPEIHAVIKDLSISSYEIVIVDGGSTDNTRTVAIKHGAHLITQREAGYAPAFNEGLNECKGKYIITLDGDYSHPAELISQLYKERDLADVVIGSRWIQGGSFHGPLLRKYLSKLLNYISRVVIDLPIRDISSGYRLYRADFVKNLTLTSKDFSILEEVIVKGANEGRRFSEIPLTYRPRKEGHSNARFFKFLSSFMKMFCRSWVERRSASSADYDNRAYNSLNIIQRLWQRKRFTNIRELLGAFTTSGIVVDIGCGSSKIIQSIPHAIALDFSMKKLRCIRKTNPIRLCASSVALPFTDESIDCVIHSQLIEHLASHKIALTEMKRTIKKGGVLIIGTVNYASALWQAIERLYGFIMPYAYADEHITHYTEKSLSDELVSLGFNVVDIRRIFGGEFTLKAIKQ
jgi:dolichol-phosphate mannosyltransferase